MSHNPITPLGWLRVGVRGLAAILVLVTGLVLLLALRLVERPLWGLHRPWTPAVTQAVCKVVLAIFGLRYRVTGTPMRASGALVANHSSWLDILALNAVGQLYFVAKSDVAGWPGIGWLARATGTVFIRRQGREARAQLGVFETRLRAGHRLLFFPEGTSTDGSLVLPFKSTLFEAFFSEDLHPVLSIQPVTVTHKAPHGEAAGFYGWWGDMALGPHLAQVLAVPRQGRISIVYHGPLKVADYANRKAIAAACEAAVRPGFTPGGQA